MTTYYVGIGGNNANAGTSWAQRKLTLNGAEDIPVAAGDTVYIGAGTYREALTCDVDGSSGSPITYIGDYDGTHTDGTGGAIRITASDNDTTATRTTCISAASKNYRAFKNISFDGTTNGNYAAIYQLGDHGIVDGCNFQALGRNGVWLSEANITIKNCYFMSSSYYSQIAFVGSADTDFASTIENCVFIGGRVGISLYETIGVTIKNCTFISCIYSVLQEAAVVGENYLYNSVVLYSALQMVAAGDLIEDYNNLFGVTRTNVDAGAHSNSYLALHDTRWFFEAIAGGSMLTPFDLAGYSGLINVAGTSPTTSDMRGTTVQGAQREWGALEYDSTLDIEAGAGGGLLTHPGMTAGMRG